MTYLGDLDPGSLMRVQTRCGPELQSSEGLTRAGVTSSKVADSQEGWPSPECVI